MKHFKNMPMLSIIEYFMHPRLVHYSNSSIGVFLYVIPLLLTLRIFHQVIFSQNYNARFLETEKRIILPIPITTKAVIIKKIQTTNEVALKLKSK